MTLNINPKFHLQSLHDLFAYDEVTILNMRSGLIFVFAAAAAAHPVAQSLSFL
jgi:hypothetical protein